jgi:hypothetical protein
MPYYSSITDIRVNELRTLQERSFALYCKYIFDYVIQILYYQTDRQIDWLTD